MELKIHLKDIRMYGFHGVHPLENQVGLDFIINISIGVNTNPTMFELNETINYESVFQILKHEFSITELLLENLANRIIARIESTFPLASSVDISIMKEGAFIEHLQGKVGISISKTFHQV